MQCDTLYNFLDHPHLLSSCSLCQQDTETEAEVCRTRMVLRLHASRPYNFITLTCCTRSRCQCDAEAEAGVCRTRICSKAKANRRTVGRLFYVYMLVPHSLLALAPISDIKLESVKQESVLKQKKIDER